jgi:sialic acid synthase SpsE
MEYTFPKEQKALLKQPFYIAEISCNHMGDHVVLLQSVAAAFDSGAHAVKLQSSTPDSLTRNFDTEEFYVHNSNSPWNGRHLYDLYIETCTPLNWPIELINDYKKRGKIIFSTPFSPDMVDMLEENANPDYYKVSSIDWNYIDLIQRCCDTNKPVFISLVKPSEQLPALLSFGFKNLIPMLCISQYPSKPEHMAFNELMYLKQFEIFGFSDHSLTPSLSSLAISHGATVIEKHFMLHDKIVSADAHFSLIPSQFKYQTMLWNEIFLAVKSNSIDTTIPIGRSVYFEKDVNKGEILTKEMLCIIRPGGGLSPLEIDSLIGNKLKNNVRRGDKLMINDIILTN